ncbi:MAG: dihydroorotase [Alphaproteobacteria bacterium]|nr:dihydroorotase [Alphaproteobacteria bacterium]
MLFDLLIKSGTLVSHAGTGVADIGMRGGRIVAIGNLDSDRAANVVDATGLHILPGLIDTQVHFREPGMEQAEDLESGTRGAVLGGITGLFEMPNTKPLTTTPAAIADKLRRAESRAWCDHAFYIGATAENAADLAEWERTPGCCGVKVFMGASTGDLLVPDDETLTRVLASGSRRVAIHSEDNARLDERKDFRGDNVANHPVWRDVESALKSTRRLLAIAEEAQRRVHVLHVTTAEEMALLADHKDLVTVEVTPQHLTLSAPECYEELGSRAQMNPPIREARHREALWAGLRQGVVDVIGSDHAPHPLEAKSKPYPNSPSGMTGVQTTVPLMLDHVAAGRLSLDHLVDLMAASPARIFGLVGKGRVALGYDADLTIVDLAAKREITRDWIASKAGWSPFEGRTVLGWPVMTVIRGQIVMRDGELGKTPTGRPLRFLELEAA